MTVLLLLRHGSSLKSRVQVGERVLEAILVGGTRSCNELADLDDAVHLLVVSVSLHGQMRRRLGVLRHVDAASGYP